MCSILSWSGLLPKGALTRLLVQSESRGRDSTGVAFRTLDEAGRAMNLCYRQTVPARTFVELHKKFMSDARRSRQGIAHCRRASPGMPVDNPNAHPYVYPASSRGFLFAHNGRIENWRDVKEQFCARFGAELEKLVAESGVSGETPEDAASKIVAGGTGVPEELATEVRAVLDRVRYVSKATTDSMVLGPCVEDLDFSPLVGCMSVTWIKADRVFAYRCSKEAVSANVVWRYLEPKEDEPSGDQTVTVVASTPEILSASFELLPNVEFNLELTGINEGKVYELTPTGIEDRGRVPSPTPEEDAFTSATVEDKDGVPLVTA